MPGDKMMIHKHVFWRVDYKGTMGVTSDVSFFNDTGSNISITKQGDGDGGKTPTLDGEAINDDKLTPPYKNPHKKQ
jgi:hypothetical protein